MLHNLTIKSRLVFVVALLCLLMLAIGTGGILALRSSEASMQTVYHDRLVPLEQLDRVVRLVNRNQLTLTTALVKGPASFAESANAIRSARNDQATVWKQYDATYQSPDEKAIAKEAADAMDAFDKVILVPALAALDAGDSSAISALAAGPMTPRYLPVRHAMNKLMKLQLDVAQQEFRSSEARYTLFLRGAIGAIVAGLLIGGAIAAWLLRSVMGPIAHAVAVAEAVADGDLSREVDDRGGDEMARMLRALRHMQHKLRIIVGGVREAADAIHTAAGEISEGNADLSRRTEDQAANLEETASSMEELTSTVKQTADNARQASQLASVASDSARAGGQVVLDMGSTMDQIRGSSEQIADIISVIDGIAFQTNILALNAAVEAARAGDQGRGFAVVAGEVRSLAARSSAAAREIKQLITTATANVERGTALMQATGDSMERIVQAVRQVDDIMAEISSATGEQSQGIDQINLAIVQIDETTQQNAALVEEAAAASVSMKDQAQMLQQAVAVFRLASDRPAEPGRGLRGRRSVARSLAYAAPGAAA